MPTFNWGVMLLWTILALALLPMAGTAKAEDPGAGPALPSMARCADISPPFLPERWRGTFLMAPFSKGQLVLGDFLHDSTVGASRIRLYGLRHGSLDLVIKGQSTFLLSQDEASASGCTALGDTDLRPLPRAWLASKAQCAGSAPVAGLPLDWWKTPSNDGASAGWMWYRTGTSLPFRLMFTQPSKSLAVLGWYAFSYQTRFEPLQSTGLGAVAAECDSSRALAKGDGERTLRELLKGMDRSAVRADTDIARLMPELDANCPDMPPPGWPAQAEFTAFMTPPGFTEGPRAAEVLYDSSRKTMRTRSFWPMRSELATDDALLLDGYGYSVVRRRGGGLSCGRSLLPGALRPNWPETGGCSCEASVKGNTALAPQGPTRIYLCPMTAPRVVWAWFGPGNRPVVFMETSAPGDDPAGVLTLVDYDAWEPGRVPASDAFGVPAQCPVPGAPEAASQGPSRAMQTGARRCGACHLDQGPVH